MRRCIGPSRAAATASLPTWPVPPTIFAGLPADNPRKSALERFRSVRTEPILRQIQLHTNETRIAEQRQIRHGAGLAKLGRNECSEQCRGCREQAKHAQAPAVLRSPHERKGEAGL